MTLWEIEFVYEQMRRYGYRSPMLDVGGIFDTTVAQYMPNRILQTKSGHIWSNIDRNCVCTHDVEAYAMDDKFDEYHTIVSTSTLEHCTHPFRFIAAIASVLTPGGLLILSAPFAWPIHGDANGDRWRFAPAGLDVLCSESDLTVIDSGCEPIVPEREMSFVVASKEALADRSDFNGEPPLC